MRFDIITIFPQKVIASLSEGVIGKAQQAGKITVAVHDLRKWTDDKRKTVDDRVFGGGPGMLLLLEPIYRCLKELGVYPTRPASTKVLLTSAAGKTWDQTQAQEFSETVDRLVLICGNYEGVDHRVQEHLVDGAVSVGNFVLTGGELAAAIIVDSTARLLAGVLGNEQSLAEESHSSHSDITQEYPQYTRPAVFQTEEGEAWEIPTVLTSGDHTAVKRWRQAHSN